MSTITKETWRLSTDCVGVEQRVVPGSSFTGERPDDVKLPVHRDPSRNVYVIEPPSASGGGLFTFTEWFSDVSGNAHVAYVHVICSAAVAWEVFLTSGLKDGTALTVDDPVHDVFLSDGEGSGALAITTELLRGQCIRFTSVANTGTSDMRVIVSTTKTTSEFGRVAP